MKVLILEVKYNYGLLIVYSIQFWLNAFSFQNFLAVIK